MNWGIIMNNKPIRVLMIGPSLELSNGVASFQMNYIKNISSKDVEFDFAILYERPSPYIDQIKNRGGKIYLVPKINDIFNHIKISYQIIKEGKYDVVHDNSLNKTIFLMFFSKILGVPVRILHSHSAQLGETKKKKIINSIFLPILKQQCNLYLACSELAGKCLFKRKKFIFIPNAIDMSKYSESVKIRKSVKETFNCQDKTIIGTVGRISPQKNPFFAMDVFKEYLKRNPHAMYWWIGTGILDDEVKEYTKKIGIENYVKFFGSRSDVNELYQAMDVLFMPSLFEGLPVTVIEAQAMNLKCVISDVITQEVEFSNLINWVSLNEKAEKWSIVLDDTVKNCDLIVEKDTDKFDIKCCAKNLVTIYRNCLDNKGI